MGWIVQGLMDVLISFAGEAMEFLISIFVDFSIDIGYDPSTSVWKLFSPDYYKNASGLLDRVFPSVGNFLAIFMYVAYILLAVLMLFKLLQSMLGPVLSSSESPGKIVANTVIAAVGVTYSYTLFIIAEKLANEVYDLFKGQFGLITEFGTPSVGDYLKSSDRLFKSSSALGLSELGLTLVMLFIFVTMIIQFGKLILEAYERYVTLGLLFYTSPLAFAALGSDSTKKIFSSWTQMVLSQFLLMMMNLFFIGGFYAAFIYVFAPGDPSWAGFVSPITGSVEAQDYIFYDGADFISKMFLLIGWLVVGQKVDEHLRSLGLSVSQSGHGLGAALMGGAMATKQLITSASKAVRSTSGLARKIGEGRNAAARNEASAARRASAIEKASRPLADKGKLTPDQTGAGYRENSIQRDKTGTITKDGARGVMNAPRESDGKTAIRFGTKDAKETMNQMGISLKDRETGIIPQNWSVEDGLITASDRNGNIMRQLGDSDRYKVADDAAALKYDTPIGTVIEPATQRDINQGCSAMVERLRNTDGLRPENGVAWEPGRNEKGELNGTAIGYMADMNGDIVKDSRGNAIPVCQAKLDQVAEFDESLGGIKTLKGNDGNPVEQKALAMDGLGFTYSVQDLSDPAYGQHMHEAGFEKVRDAAASPLLEVRSVPESNASVISHEGRSAVERLMENEDAIHIASIDPHPYKPWEERFGAELNSNPAFMPHGREKEQGTVWKTRPAEDRKNDEKGRSLFQRMVSRKKK